MMRQFPWYGSLALLLLAAPAAAPAGEIFYDDMSGGANWTINKTSDASAAFGFDYSALGIPVAPHTTDGTTLGLRMAANISSGTVNELNAVVTGLNLSGQYGVEFDFWINANGPFPAGGTGSTEFLGGGVGLNGGDAGRDGASLIISGEGGAARDWELFKNKGEQFIESRQYNPALTSNNNSDPLLSSWFPGQSPPALQQANYPQQTGTTLNGSGGFAWHTMRILVDSTAIGSGLTSNPGVARFEVDGHWIGTIDNSNGGTVVDMTGGVGVIYADIFTSISNNPALSFGLVDNFRVSVVPEPSSWALLSVGGLGLIGLNRLRSRRGRGSRPVAG